MKKGGGGGNMEGHAVGLGAEPVPMAAGAASPAGGGGAPFPEQLAGLVHIMGQLLLSSIVLGFKLRQLAASTSLVCSSLDSESPKVPLLHLRERAGS